MSTPYLAGTTLSREDLRAAIEKIQEATYTACIGGNQHVVHPREWERGGYAACANCGALVDLGER